MSGKSPYPKTDAEYLDAYGVRPCCRDMSRAEVTSLLNRELVRLRLERKNAYAYWAHEVKIRAYMARGGCDKERRVDFVAFEPAQFHTAVDDARINKGTFSFYEVKSCAEDLKSGYGLSFYGDENWAVIPVEAHGPCAEAVAGDRWLAEQLRDSRFLAYGKARNGRPKFVELGKWGARPPVRKFTAAELLLLMMRAMIANSGHSDVSHEIKRGEWS